MNYTHFITDEELKAQGFINDNIDDEYLDSARYEAQTIYLKEILGDRLYKRIDNDIKLETLTEDYQLLLDEYIKPFLSYNVIANLVMVVNFKVRNAGVVTQYGTDFQSSDMKDAEKLREYYNSKAEFFQNRLIEFLKKHSDNYTEYCYDDRNITQPNDSRTVGGIFLGNTNRKSCLAITSRGGGGTIGEVEWSDIKNKPNFNIKTIEVTDENGIKKSYHIYSNE